MVSTKQQTALLRGDVLIATNTHAGKGAAVTAQMYVPLVRSQLWEQLTDYGRWVHYFPDITQSRELEASVKQHVKQQSKRITRDRKSTRLNSSHPSRPRMPSSA